MCVPSLNEIRESIFQLLCTKDKTYGGGAATDLKQTYPTLFVWGDVNIQEKYKITIPEIFSDFPIDSHRFLDNCASL